MRRTRPSSARRLEVSSRPCTRTCAERPSTSGAALGRHWRAAWWQGELLHGARTTIGRCMGMRRDWRADRRFGHDRPLTGLVCRHWPGDGGSGRRRCRLLPGTTATRRRALVYVLDCPRSQSGASGALVSDPSLVQRRAVRRRGSAGSLLAHHTPLPGSRLPSPGAWLPHAGPSQTIDRAAGTRARAPKRAQSHV